MRNFQENMKEHVRAIESRLGAETPAHKKTEIIHIHADIQRKHQALIAAAFAGKHTRESFAEAMYELLCEGPKRTADILDAISYEKFWDMKPGELPTREELGIHPSFVDWLPADRELS